jgi:PadR family transcriptional regulator PadR
MKKGLIEFAVLLIISQGEVYVSEILNKLTEAKLLTVEGTLYPLLNRLRIAKLLQYRWEESLNGPPRKYYFLTAEGSTVLKELRTEWQELVSSINFLSVNNEKKHSN